jgi:hypothetical protein
MVASQIIALVALIQYAGVQYFLNTEESRKYVLISLQQSNVLAMLNSEEKVMNGTELFTCAVEKYDKFNQTCIEIKENNQNISKNSKKCFIKYQKKSKINPMKSAKPYDFGIDRIKERGSSIDRIEAESENYFDGKLGITDVMNIITIRDLYTKFDEYDEGIITINELQKAFQYFGYFYSHLQTCAIMESFWQCHHTTLEHHREIDLETFLRILINFKEPFRIDMNKTIFEEKPSIICDYLARIAYPILIFTKCLVFWLMLSSYGKE